MTNEKIDKRKKPTRRVTCPDCGVSYAVTSFKLHRCASHDRQQWIKVEGNDTRYQEVLKPTIQLDMNTEEQLKQGDNTIENTVGKTLHNQVDEQQHISKHQLEDKNMSEENPKPKTETKHEYESECGECGHQFDGTPKYCAGCGVELAW